MSIEMIRMSKKNFTRLSSVRSSLSGGARPWLRRLWAAPGAIQFDLGGSDYIDVNGGSAAWTALALLVSGRS